MDRPLFLTQFVDNLYKYLKWKKETTRISFVNSEVSIVHCIYSVKKFNSIFVFVQLFRENVTDKSGRGDSQIS